MITPASQRLNPEAALERFLATQSTEVAAAHLNSAVEHNRTQLKSAGVPLPDATNPLLVSLMESLKVLPSTEVSARIAMVTALGRTADPAVLPLMLLMTGARSKDVRQAVAIALGCIRHPLSAYLLLRLLQDGSSRIRQAALHGLLRLLLPNTVESILAACLFSKSLLKLIVETLRLVSESHRAAFFELLASPETLLEPGLKIVADWLQHEFQDPASARGLQPCHGNSESRKLPTGSASPTPTSRLTDPLLKTETTSAENAEHDSSDSCDVIEYIPPQPPLHRQQQPAAQQTSPRANRKDSSRSDIFSWHPQATPPAATSSQWFCGSGQSATATLEPDDVAAVANEFDKCQSDVRLVDECDNPEADLAWFDQLTESFTEDASVTSAPGDPISAGCDSQTPVSINGLPATSELSGSGPSSQQVCHTSTPTVGAMTFTAEASAFEAAATIVTRTAEVDPAIDEDTNEVSRKAALHDRAQARLGAARGTAFAAILNDAEEIPGKLSKPLMKRVADLTATPSTKVNEIIAQLRELGATRAPAVLPTLAEFCQKSAKAIRAACAEALGNISHQGSVVLLLKLVADPAGTVTEAAVKSLMILDLEPIRPVLLAAGLCGTSLRTIVTSGVESAAVDKKPDWERYLLQVAEGQDPDAAAFAVSLLARIAGESRLEIFQQLARDPAPVLRAAAVEALARTQAKRAISQINEALEDTDPIVRAQAALSVATMYSPRSVDILKKLVFDEHLTVRRNAAQTMSRIDEADLAEIIATALQQESDATTVEYLLDALARNGSNSSLQILQQYVEGETRDFLEPAFNALRQLRIPASIPIFRRLLNDHSADLRCQSAEQLVVLKSREDLPRLREMLRKDPDEIVRAACARALGDFGDDTSLELLEDALEDHSAVRIQAVIAMGRMGQVSARLPLLALLNDPQSEIRYQSVKALGQLRLTDTAEFIEPLLQDADELVRRGAERALNDLGISAGNRRARQWKRRVAMAAGWIAPSSLAALIPGGAKTLLTVVVLVAASAGMFAFKGILAAASGEHFEIEEPVSISMDAKGDNLLVVRQYGVCEVWNLKTGLLNCRQSLPGRVTGGLFTEDSGVLLNQDGKFALYEFLGAELREKGQALDLPERITHTVIHRKTKTLFVAYLKDSTSHLVSYDLQSMQKTSDRPLSTILGGQMTISPDGHFVASMSGSTIVLFDLVNNQTGSFSFSELTGGAQPGDILSMSFSDDMKYLAICQSAYGIAVIELDSTSVKARLEPKDSFGYSWVRFAPGSHDLIAAGSSGSVVVSTREFSTQNDFTIEGCRSAIDMFSVSDDNKQLAVGSTEELDLFVGDVGTLQMSHHLDPVIEK